ncbi:unnamed protein product [Rangifer tarandus platyrhynchus]|uniref:Translation initiation factor IF-2-like n=1 Tax=Rangifer tarandus platyrhynchus TaxID=3082113 RepID=A0ABN8XUB1_RANTA|nr:unnamed protein product [Rangifer tarandus platyrhynchus]
MGWRDRAGDQARGRACRQVRSRRAGPRAGGGACGFIVYGAGLTRILRPCPQSPQPPPLPGFGTRGQLRGPRARGGGLKWKYAPGRGGRGAGGGPTSRDRGPRAQPGRRVPGARGGGGRADAQPGPSSGVDRRRVDRSLGSGTADKCGRGRSSAGPQAECTAGGAGHHVLQMPLQPWAPTRLAMPAISADRLPEGARPLRERAGQWAEQLAAVVPVLDAWSPAWRGSLPRIRPSLLLLCSVCLWPHPPDPPPARLPSAPGASSDHTSLQMATGACPPAHPASISPRSSVSLGTCTCSPIPLPRPQLEAALLPSPPPETQRRAPPCRPHPARGP